MSNITRIEEIQCSHAVLCICGSYIDMYKEYLTQDDYFGLPSIRIAIMTNPRWVQEVNISLLLLAMNSASENEKDISKPCIDTSDNGLCFVDKSLLLPRGDIGRMLTNILSGVVDPNSLPVNESSENSKDNRELRIQKRMAATTGGLMEVSTDYGRIDILTDSEVIEIKKASQWKSGIGQILVYGGMYPSHTKRLHLFGLTEKFNIHPVLESCERLGIVLSTEKDE